MKRLLFALVVFLLIAVSAIASLPLFLSSATVRSNILDHLQKLTGREVSFRGDPSVSFQPFLGIEINNLTISDPNSSTDNLPLLSVERVKAQLDILPALIGDIRITQYRLESPRLNLKVYADGRSSWFFQDGQIKTAFSETLQSLEDDKITPYSANLGTFVILDGAIRYEDAITGQMDNITSINAIVDWPQTSAPATIESEASWQGETISAKIGVADPLKLMAGGESQTTFNLNSTPATIDFDGTANMLSNLFVKGTIKLKTLSLKRFSEFFALDFARLYVPGELEMSGNLEASPASIRLMDAEIKIAGHTANGVLSLTSDELNNTSLDGTLAFETIDLSGYLTQAAEPDETHAQNENKSGVVIDLRLSANSVNTSIIQLDEVAAALNVSGKNWTIDIGDSQALGGNIVARIGKRIENELPIVLLDISAKNLDFAELSALYPDQVIAGTGRGNLDASLRTDSIASVLDVSKLSGTVSANLANGSVTGIDIRKLLQSDPKELEQSTDLGLLTDFQSSNAKMFIINGVASISKSLHKDETGEIGIVGRVDLRQGNLALTAEEVEASSDVTNRLFIGGTLQAPLVSLKRTEYRNNPDTSENLQNSN